MIKVGLLNFTKVFHSGGAFQYITSLFEGLKNDENFEVYVFYDDKDFWEKYKGTISFTPVLIAENEKIFPKIIRGSCSYIGVKSPLLGRYDIIRDLKMDLLISFGSDIGFHLGIPVIGCIWDVMYRYYPNLSEYSRVGNLVRDISTKRLLKHSDYVVVDSNQSAGDLTSFFKVEASKLITIPMCAPPHIYKYSNMKKEEADEICSKYKLPEGFIFYPAQFWSHKNHERLVKALHLLKIKYGTTVHTVFVGSQWESYDSVIRLINVLEMKEQIKCLGYIPEKDLVAIYKKAVALVFVSYAEYTNLPVVEAMVLGTPVLCSNKFSMPEQVGDAGLLFDPFDIEDMAEKIYKIWTDKDLRFQLISKGLRRAEEFSAEHFINKWKNVILKVARKRHNIQ